MSRLALVPEEITTSFRDALGEKVESTSTFQGQAAVVVTPDAWTDAFTHARDVLACDFFTFVSAIDWVTDDADAADAAEEPEEGAYVAPARDLLQMVGRVSSTGQGHGVTIKSNLPKDAPVIDTLTSVYAGADWHEREVMEMFGISVSGHPHPEKLYLTDEFEGHPLLKSYKLGAREVKPWPGDVNVEEMPEDAPVLDDAGNVVELPEPDVSEETPPEESS